MFPLAWLPAPTSNPDAPFSRARLMERVVRSPPKMPFDPLQTRSTSFTTPGAWLEREGTRVPDNIFRMDDPPDGGDAVLAFTKQMREDGPELQWDPTQ